jgi:hypothetical protein
MRDDGRPLVDLPAGPRPPGDGNGGGGRVVVGSHPRARLAAKPPASLHLGFPARA